MASNAAIWTSATWTVRHHDAHLSCNAQQAGLGDIKIRQRSRYRTDSQDSQRQTEHNLISVYKARYRTPPNNYNQITTGCNT